MARSQTQMTLEAAARIQATQVGASQRPLPKISFSYGFEQRREGREPGFATRAKAAAIRNTRAASPSSFKSHSTTLNQFSPLLENGIARNMSGVPIILCGKTEQIGTGVIENLKPEYEVIHFVLTAEAGAEEIPCVLRGQAPPTKSSGLGSGVYDSRPKAIVFGGGYDDAAVDFVAQSVADTSIPLLKADLSIPMPPVGPEYGKRILERCKHKLEELEKEGKLNGSESGIFLY
ncbi:hypothetical protein JX266_009668 [Neoarthrinium moseri]|nr:hypothetical protein JX266_009668 [Neoarthrinium moseri]